MRQFNWNDEKNLSFEDVLDCFENGNFYGVFENPSSNFPHQEVFLVKINDYPCIVPFAENDQEIFLKTIIPDRRFKKFIKENEDE